MDAGGAMLQGFPVWIPTGTQYPLLLLDPDEQHNYQIFVTGNYFKVSAFNIQGRLMPNWNPRKVWPNLSSSMSSLQTGSHALLYALNEKGRLDFFTYDAKAYPLSFDSNMVFKQVQHLTKDSSLTRFYTLDTFGVFRTFDLGSGGSLQMKNYNTSGFTSFEPAKNSPFNDEYFILQNTAGYVLINKDGKTMSQISNADSVVSHVQVLFLNGDMRLIYLHSKDRKIHVEDLRGRPYQPFPQSGTTTY